MTSELITLRPLTVNDAFTSFRWRNDATLWKYTRSRPNCYITPDMECAWARKVISDPTRANFAIMLGNTYIGNIYLVNISGDTAGLGMVIGDRSAHGHGYGRQALELLKKEARLRGINTIRFGVNRENTAAIITYLKSGASLPQSWNDNEMLTMTISLK